MVPPVDSELPSNSCHILQITSLTGTLFNLLSLSRGSFYIVFFTATTVKSLIWSQSQKSNHYCLYSAFQEAPIFSFEKITIESTPPQSTLDNLSQWLQLKVLMTLKRSAELTLIRSRSS